MNTPTYRTARALYPEHRWEWEEAFIYEPLSVPDDHPVFPIFENRKPGEANPEADFESRTPAEKGIGNQETVFTDPIPARMLNEFVYCPRLFFYEFVNGVFIKSEDTERGAVIHEKVDRGRGDLPKAGKKKEKGGSSGPEGRLALEGDAQGVVSESSSAMEVTENDESAEAGEPGNDTIHSRSAMLSSERLGVVAKMDLVEVKITARSSLDLFASREVQSVTPVDYKAGAPRAGKDVNELWDADKMQLGLQILILRDNGYTCDEGVIYYRATKQRVRLTMTTELEAWILQQIAAAREVAGQGHIPPPLVNSPKCVRCSLAPVCLPDETRMLNQATEGVNPSRITADAWSNRTNKTPGAVRRLMAARDEERALYLNTPGLRVGLKS
ncbi:MAG: hypothetical protein RL693_2338, partial [Verrucomicrobiota bacterium]